MDKTRLYRVYNKARIGTWFFATDEKDALDQALSQGRIKAAANATVEDQTDFYVGDDQRRGVIDTQEIMDAGMRGSVARYIPPVQGKSWTRGTLK
jgi:hypothetical protein